MLLILGIWFSKTLTVALRLFVVLILVLLNAEADLLLVFDYICLLVDSA